ncbi:MAG: ATP-binding protein [Myxococcota bacterium]
MARNGEATLVWLVRLRWFAIVGQLASIAGAMALTDVPLELHALFTLVAVSALSNVVLHFRARRGPATPRVVFAVLAGDVVLLTGLLLAAGGPMNPFSVFYLVSVALAGVLLGPRGAWALAGLTTLGFAVLFILPSGPMDLHSQHMHASPLHLYGMGVAYLLAAAFVAYFVAGVARALRRREAELAELRARAEKNERALALATFATAAAHELGSPLATIAVAAAELERAAEGAAPALREDAALIRQEALRCRNILLELGQRGGNLAGEAPEPTTVAAVFAALAEKLDARSRARLDVAPDDQALVVPRGPLLQALGNLVRNALQATPAGRVRLAAERRGGFVALAVADDGPGFAPEVRAELGTPFVSTRPGEGLGLGLHIARRVADATGGRLEVRAASPGPGSVVALVIPLDVVAPAVGA